MNLPVITAPEYTTVLPSTGEKVKFRPFLVQEEKIFLIAYSSGNAQDIFNAVKQIIGTCVKSKTKAEDMSMFDIEYLFLQLRAKSEGEEITLELICSDDGETVVPVVVNIEDIKIETPENHKKVIDIDDEFKIVMRYPTIENYMDLSDTEEIEDPKEKAKKETENNFKLLRMCISEVYQGETSYDFTSYSTKEQEAFLNSVPKKAYLKLREFFDTMPSINHQIKFKNPKTKKNNTYTIRGLSDFLS